MREVDPSGGSLANAARRLLADRRKRSAVTGAATLGIFGLRLLLSPQRSRRHLGERATAWYQRELALFDLGQAVSLLLELRRSRNGGDGLPAALRASSITTLMLAAAHVAEAVRPNARARGYHVTFAVLDLVWAVRALHAADPTDPGFGPGFADGFDEAELAGLDPYADPTWSTGNGNGSVNGAVPQWAAMTDPTGHEDGLDKLRE